MMRNFIVSLAAFSTLAATQERNTATTTQALDYSGQLESLRTNPTYSSLWEELKTVSGAQGSAYSAFARFHGIRPRPTDAAFLSASASLFSQLPSAWQSFQRNEESLISEIKKTQSPSPTPTKTPSLEAYPPYQSFQVSWFLDTTVWSVINKLGDASGEEGAAFTSWANLGVIGTDGSRPTDPAKISSEASALALLPTEFQSQYSRINSVSLEIRKSFEASVRGETAVTSTSSRALPTTTANTTAAGNATGGADTLHLGMVGCVVLMGAIGVGGVLL